MDMSQYRDLFVSESRSHLSALGDLLVQLEKTPDDAASINEAFRHAHSMKGMAATMGYDLVVKIAHLMEDLLSRIRSGECRMHPALADLLLAGSDALGRLVGHIESGSESNEDISDLIERLTRFEATPEKRKTATFSPPVDTNAQTPETAPAFRFRKTDSSKTIRIKTETLDHLVNITGELITNRHRLGEAINVTDAPDCREPLHKLTALLGRLRDEVFKARMVPFAFIAERFPRLVRDLARTQGKNVDFKFYGKEIELDRSIIEDIAEPIVHILRNAVDHGLESTSERAAVGKPPVSTLSLTVRRDQDHVELVISDDGRGMDPEQLKRAAVAKSLITMEQAGLMTDQEAYQLICKPGFSTAAAITDISGRGVGMDAVRNTVQALSGFLTIKSQIARGSSFIIRVPTTISIIQAMIVRSGSFELAFPLNIIIRSIELKTSDIYEEAGQPVVLVENDSLPFRPLRQTLGLPQGPAVTGSLFPAIICHTGGTRTVLGVDRIVGQKEIFIRPLRSPLSKLTGINGAAVAGDGKVMFVVDTGALLHSEQTKQPREPLTH